MNPKNARTLCKKQLMIGKQVLKAKTRKAARALLNKVPGKKVGNVQKGLRWWDYIQSIPEARRTFEIEAAAPILLKNCIRKYSA